MVVAILSILAVVGARSITQPSSSLSAAGEVVTGMAMWARQIAVSTNNPTALVVLTKDASIQGGAYREFAILKFVDGGWKQASPWKKLPVGVIVDPATSASSFFNNASLPSALTGNGVELTRGGATVPSTDVAWQLFLPRGGLLNPRQSPILRLVNGQMTGEASAKYHQGGSSAEQKHYYEVVLLGVSGLVKVVIP